MDQNENIYVILLASGNSTRFNNPISKQIYHINNKPVIQYSIESILPLNPIKIIIVVNEKTYETINNMIDGYLNDEIFKIILNDDTNSHRLDSIGLGLKYLESIECNNSDNIIIHDVARPWVTTNYYQKIINEMDEECKYVQYFTKISGGLFNVKNNNFVDRDDFIEIVTPLAIKYDIFREIYNMYILKDVNGNRIHYEFIPILKDKKYKFKLIEGNYRKLRKITTIEDIED